MLSLDKKLADKIGSNFIIANEGTEVDTRDHQQLLEMQTVYFPRQAR